MADACAGELDEISGDETLPASADADTLDSVGNGCADDGTDRRVHAGRVTAAGQYADSFWFVHCESSFNSICDMRIAALENQNCIDYMSCGSLRQEIIKRKDAGKFASASMFLPRKNQNCTAFNSFFVYSCCG